LQIPVFEPDNFELPFEQRLAVHRDPEDPDSADGAFRRDSGRVCGCDFGEGGQQNGTGGSQPAE